MKSSYRGRFAPTPSGPLHLGSLLTALASWLDARAAGGHWLLRIDDLDQARCPPGAESRILRQLEDHGLFWDEPPRYQSAHLAQYETMRESLRDLGLLYACSCTRATLMRTATQGPDGPVYPGTCRMAPVSRRDARALSLRFAVPNERSRFIDRIQGEMTRDNRSEIGDFAVWRSDGIAGYHLACVVDDVAQGITHIVRGADLLGASFSSVCCGAVSASPIPNWRMCRCLPKTADASSASKITDAA